MFKVPEWGNDIPKSSDDVAKVFKKKNKTKKSQDTNKANTSNNNVNNKLKGVSKPKKRVFEKYKNGKGQTKSNRFNNNVIKNKRPGRFVDKVVDSFSQAVNKNNRKFTQNYKQKPAIKNKIANKKNKPKNANTRNSRKTDTEDDNTTNATTNSDSSLNSSVASEKKTNKRKKELKENKTDDIDVSSFDTDEPDRLLLNAKRKKYNEKIKMDDTEDELFNINKTGKKEVSVNNDPGEGQTLTKTDRRKQVFRAMLQNSDNKRTHIEVPGNPLRQRMLERLKAAQFRYLNEKLYTSSGKESQELFKSDPAAFDIYHEGYQQQLKKWPVNPLDIIVNRILKMPKTHLVADMGCGRAELARRVPHAVRSFDLAARAPGVEACDMARTPLPPAAMHALVYCLALMGTDLTQYLLEANRVLKIGGHLLIAEVESRFDNADTFTSEVQRLGFSLKKLDRTHKVFLFMEFTKVREAPAKRAKLPSLTLKPCLYKRR